MSRFRWVECQLDALKRCKTKPQLTEALRSLPQSLDATYERILQNIADEDLEYAKRALWWSIQPCRPLTVEELAEAAVIDLNCTPAFHRDYRFFDAREHIQEILGCLITVSATQAQRRPSMAADYDVDFPSPFTHSPAPDAANIVRLSHFSVQEYLWSYRLAQSMNAKLQSFKIPWGTWHRFIGDCCLQYIFCYATSDERQDITEDITAFPLLLYSCQQWPQHSPFL